MVWWRLNKSKENDYTVNKCISHDQQKETTFRKLWVEISLISIFRRDSDLVDYISTNLIQLVR